MNNDKSVNLNLSIPDFGAQRSTDGFSDQQGGSGSTREEADSTARERFESLMAAKEKNQDKPSAALLGPTGSAGPAGPAGPKSAEVMLQPFALFQPQYALNDRPEKVMATNLFGRVDHLIGRMMVGDGSSGNRQVRIELQDDALLGVSITVQQIDGRLQVDFVCSNEQSRLQLNRAAPSLANQLADRLKQDVLVRVQTDDDEDLCLYEIVGTAFT